MELPHVIPVVNQAVRKGPLVNQIEIGHLYTSLCRLNTSVHQSRRITVLITPRKHDSTGIVFCSNMVLFNMPQQCISRISKANVDFREDPTLPRGRILLKQRPWCRNLALLGSKANCLPKERMLSAFHGMESAPGGNNKNIHNNDHIGRSNFGFPCIRYRSFRKWGGTPYPPFHPFLIGIFRGIFHETTHPAGNPWSGLGAAQSMPPRRRGPDAVSAWKIAQHHPLKARSRRWFLIFLIEHEGNSTRFLIKHEGNSNIQYYHPILV